MSREDEIDEYNAEDDDADLIEEVKVEEDKREEVEFKESVQEEEEEPQNVLLPPTGGPAGGAGRGQRYRPAVCRRRRDVACGKEIRENENPGHGCEKQGGAQSRKSLCRIWTGRWPS